MQMPFVWSHCVQDRKIYLACRRDVGRNPNQASTGDTVREDGTRDLCAGLPE